MKLLMVTAAWVLLGMAKPCFAQGTTAIEMPQDSFLIHLETPHILERGTLAGRLDVRFFDSPESVTYANLSVRYGLGRGLEAIVRGTAAKTKHLALPGGAGMIRHGGSDLELAMKFQPGKTSHVAGLIGVGIPGTPAQSRLALTLGGMVSGSLKNVTFYLNPRALFLEHNTLFGFGLGGRVRLTDTVALVGDWTPIVSGQNTRDTRTGALAPGDIYGVALRLGHTDRTGVTFDLGYANGTGATTGFGLTPGLGNKGAYYLALTLRH